MKRSIVLLMVCLAGAATLRAGEKPKVHPDSSDWKAVFTGDLSDAMYPEGVWSVADGVLTATEDKCIWTKKEYDDFVLDLEFKNAEGTNSGAFVYCSDVPNFIPNSVEVQIADDFAERWAKMPKSWQCGAIFGHKPATKSHVKKPGHWNRMTVTCRGPKITVALNGEEVNRFDMTKWTSAKENPDGTEIPPWLSKPKAKLPTRGHIGFQGKHGGVPIYFRNIRIKTIE
jgi:hypothetical protein